LLDSLFPDKISFTETFFDALYKTYDFSYPD